MANLSTYLKEKLAKHVSKIASYTPPTTITAALYSSATDDATGGTELTGNGYARVEIPSFQWDGVNGWAESASVIEFGPATGGNWLQATHIRLFDESNNPLLHGALASPVDCLQNQKIQIAAESITIGFDVGV